MHLSISPSVRLAGKAASMLLAVVALLATSAAAQSTTSSSSASSTSASATVSSSRNATTTASTTTSAQTAATTTQGSLPQLCSESDTCSTYNGECVQFGYGTQNFLIADSPTATTVGLSGNTLNITWHYEFANSTYPQKNIALYYAQTSGSSTGVTTTVTVKTFYDNPIAVIGSGATNYMWSVPNLQDGQYELHIVADQVDPNYAIALNDFQCVFDGQPMPYTTKAFKIITPNNLVNNTDKYPPNSGAAAGHRVASLAPALIGLLGIALL